jgi:hypothetical protein
MPAAAPVIAAVFAKLGGRSALGADVASEADLARIVVGRIPAKVLAQLKRRGFSRTQRFSASSFRRGRCAIGASGGRGSPSRNPIGWCG